MATKPVPVVMYDTYHHQDKKLGNDNCLIQDLLQTLTQHSFKLVSIKDVEDDHRLRPDVAGAIGISSATARINKLLPSLPNLKTISFPSAGLEGLDVQSCLQANISIGNVSTALCDIVADFAMTLILASARNLLPGVKIAKSTKLGCSLPSDGFHVTGCTLGIVGMGAIGYEVAKRGHRGFNMKILYNNRTRRSAEDEDYVGAVYYPSLHDMLPHCDVVLLSCPLTPDTRQMIGQKEFSLMKKSALFANVGRGAVVNHDELVKALESGEIGQAALDVTDPEPLPVDHPLLHMDNVIVAPHQASETEVTQQRIIDLVIGNLQSGLQGLPLVCGVNIASKE